MRNPIMVGERVYLRAMEAEDAFPLARMDAQESDTFMWRQRTPTSPIALRNWVTDQDQQRPPQHIRFSVCRIEDDRYLGMVAAMDVDWVHRTAETASFLGPAEIRGREYGTEAKHLLLEYCFDRVALHVLQSQVDSTNTRSAAALGKQGYRPAGRLKWTDVKDGRYVDALVFDLTRDDWLAARQAWRARRAAGAARP